MNPAPFLQFISCLRAPRAWRLAAALALCALSGGCNSQPKETVDYGFGMQFEQTPP